MSNYMRKNKLKRVLVMVLSAVMIAGVINILPGATMEVEAASVVKDVNLGTGGITSPTVGGNAAGQWEGSKVYFGSEQGKNLWRVLDPGAGLIFANDVVAEQEPYGGPDGSNWENSFLRLRLNDVDYKGDINKFNTIENRTMIGEITICTTDIIKNPNYGFANSEGASGTRSATEKWWLRTEGTLGGQFLAFVKADGSIDLSGDRCFENYGVRPAFNIDMSSIFFTSSGDTTKPSTFNVVSDGNTSDNIWKLTLKDGDSNFTAAALPTEGFIGQEIKVNVTTVGAGTYNQTSAMLTDASGTVVAYGKIGDATTGEKTFTIPDTVAAGNYTLHVFEEQVNGIKKTDYASKELTQSITISAAPATYDVGITAGSHMTKTSASGLESQTGLAGAMTDVVYTANAGYYFPADYSVASVNGITVTRNSDTQITVSGTPTANASIVLLAATAKSTPVVPVTYDVQVTAGSHMTKTSASGAESQTGLTGAMTAVVYTANTGYYFPADYSVTSMNGIAVTRNSDTQITVSGTPIASASIVLLSATPKPATYDVLVTAGSHMTKTSASGAESQTGLTGAMTDVVYTANTGYYFPADYSVTSLNGIAVTRNSNTQITVSGTPKASASIVLFAATAKSTPTAPTRVSGDNQKITGTTSDMEYAPSADAAKWITCTPGSTTVGAGTWYVRYKASDTTQAGKAIKVVVTTSKPMIVAGAGGTHILGTAGTLSITCSGALKDLTGIYVDGELLGEENYTVKSGGTILTLKTAYLNKLKVGTYVLKFTYGSQSAETSFKVVTSEKGSDTPGNTSKQVGNKGPQTGDSTSILWLLILMTISGIIVVRLSRQ